MSNLNFMNKRLKDENDKSEQCDELLDNTNGDLKSENGNAIALLTVLYIVITTTLIIVLFI